MLRSSFLCLVSIIPGLLQIGYTMAINQRSIGDGGANEFFPSTTTPRKITVITDEGMFRPNLAINRDGQEYLAAHTWVLFEGVPGNPPLRMELGRTDGFIHVAQHKDITGVDLGNQPHPDPKVKRSVTVLDTRTTLSNRQLWDPSRAWARNPGPPSWVEFIWREKLGLNGEAWSNKEREPAPYPFKNIQFHTSPEFVMTLLASIDIGYGGALFPGGPLVNAEIRALHDQLESNQQWELQREMQPKTQPTDRRAINKLIYHDSMDKIGGGRIKLTALYHFDMSDPEVPNEEKKLAFGSHFDYIGNYPPGGVK